MAGLSRDAREHGDRGLAEPQASVNDWAEFVIYVPQPLDDGPLLIVPRDRLSKVGLQTADQFLEYADRWHLLGHDFKTPGKPTLTREKALTECLGGAR